MSEEPVRFRWRDAWPLAKGTIHAFLTDEGQRRGAALAFFSLFSVSPIFVLLLAMLAVWMGREQAQSGLYGRLEEMIGPQGAGALRNVVAKTDAFPSGWAAALAGAVAVFGATIVLVELQASLNAIWRVRARPGRSLARLALARVLSFALILVIGFLFMASLLASAALAAFGRWMGPVWGGMPALIGVADALLSFAALTFLFALVFKILPDARIAWTDVWVGALLTAFLFTAGKAAIGFYLGWAGVAGGYGAAGSLVVLLLWVYYSAQIFLFGAEFTALYANRYGSRVKPTFVAERIPDPGCGQGPEKGVQ